MICSALLVPEFRAAGVYYSCVNIVQKPLPAL